MINRKQSKNIQNILKRMFKKFNQLQEIVDANKDLKVNKTAKEYEIYGKIWKIDNHNEKKAENTSAFFRF